MNTRETKKNGKRLTRHIGGGTYTCSDGMFCISEHCVACRRERQKSKHTCKDYRAG